MLTVPFGIVAGDNVIGPAVAMLIDALLRLADRNGSSPEHPLPYPDEHRGDLP